jgi:hypothetical protein
MMIYLSLLVALIALVVYLITANPKVAPLALWAWGAGLLAFLLQVAGTHAVGIMGGR